MASSVTRGLMVAATAPGGVLAGASVDRTLIQLPAWRLVGAAARATFGRAANLGNGLIWYPLPRIGAPRPRRLLGSVVVRLGWSAGAVGARARA